MKSERNLAHIHSEIKASIRGVTIVQVAREINKFMDDMGIVVNKEYEDDVDTVSGTKYYDFPTDQKILSIRSVNYLSGSIDSDGNQIYFPIPEHTGVTLRSDI